MVNQDEAPAAEPMEVETGTTEPAAVVYSDDWQNYAELEVPPAPEKVATYDTNGPRLMISQIVNENFKSYAGVKTLGPFHKSFTCIVGPNGSGKSNVIDSMLFVFGYRANKIRSKKISVLIHNSDQHTNLNSCSVAVHFQKIIDTGAGQDDFEVVPNTQFVVSRTAFRDNSSFYSFNGKKVPYKEVATLLRANGIDLDHNRFLILQGEVEQIAMMKPKAQTEHDEGMLEFLEDIIGSSRFKDPIELLTKRVETLSEIRGEKLNRVKVVEKEKNDLEGPKNEAMEYLRMENELMLLKNKLYQKYIHECTVNEEKAVTKRDEIKDGMKEVTAKLEEINTAKKEKVKQHKKIFKEYEHLEKECDKRKEEFSEFEQQDVKCREDLKHAKSKTKKLEKSLEQERKKVEELKAVPAKSEKEIERLKGELTKHEAQLKVDEAKLQEVMESLKTETQEIQAEKDAKETELLGMQKSVNETKSKMDVAQSELDIYLSNQKSETDKLKAVQKNLETSRHTLKERKEGIKFLEKKIPENETALGRAQKDLETATEAEAKLTDEVKDARVKVERARSSMEANKSRNKVLNALMEQKRKGKLPGIFGRLGDLGAIDAKYDVAISTACGPLDNIVCDTIDTAQKCVEFLKKENVGWATFIAVDKMSRWKDHVKKKIQTPENVPRLFDLVKVQDDKLLTVFYHALRDTLVAKDLDQATRISYGKQRYRVVSMAGHLIETSGTMSGGGTRVSKGRMGSAVVDDVNPKELQDMETRLKKNAADIQAIRENKEKLDDTVVRLTKELKEMKHTLDKYKMEIKHLEEQECSLVEQEKEQTERVKAAAPDAKELQQLEKKVAAFKKDYQKNADAAKVVQDAVQSLHKQIMDITNSKMSSAQKKVDHVSNLIDQATGQITKAGVAVKTAQRNQKKAEDKVKSLEEEQTENEQALVELEAMFKKLEEEAIKVMEAFEGAQGKMKETEEALAAGKNAVAELEKEENDLQKDHIEVKHELEKYETVVKESQMKIKHWKKELSKLSLHAVEEEETELATVAAETLESINKEEVQYQITVHEEKIVSMKPNMAAIEEYKRKEETYLKRVGELDHVTNVRDEQRRQHESLRKQRLDEFMAGFGIITYKLKEMYQMITLGGDAELELVDSLDPFSEGIVFSVRPPKKSWKNISNLSGGEKTLSSLALVFALHHFKPTPLYVMDEIDAALDFRNVSIVAHYIKERTKNAQFIIISLRNNMFELSDRLVGIYKTNNCTQTVAINPHTYSAPMEPVA